MIMEKTKICSKCKMIKSFDCFHNMKMSKDGKKYMCKICCIESSALWRKANPEKVNELNRHWRKANPEKVNELRNNWKKANPEKVKEHSRNWKKANPEKVKKMHEDWVKANPEKS